LEIRSVVYGATGWRYASRLETPAPSAAPVIGDPRSLKARIKQSPLWGPLLAKPWHALRQWKSRAESAPLDARLPFGTADDLPLRITSACYVPSRPSAKAARARGAKVGLLLQDVIPLQHPQFCAPALVLVFQDWWNQMPSSIDFLVAATQATRLAALDAMT